MWDDNDSRALSASASSRYSTDSEGYAAFLALVRGDGSDSDGGAGTEATPPSYGEFLALVCGANAAPEGMDARAAPPSDAPFPAGPAPPPAPPRSARGDAAVEEGNDAAKPLVEKGADGKWKTRRPPAPSAAAVEEGDDGVTSAVNGVDGKWKTRRDGSSAADGPVGAVRADERAPRPGRRSLLGLLPGLRADDAGGDDAEAPRRSQTSDTRQTMHTDASATLVEEDAAAAERGFVERNWRTLLSVAGFLLVSISVSFVVLVVRENSDAGGEVGEALLDRESARPSMLPSAAPSFDPTPTFETVRARGRVRCGMRSGAIDSGPYLDLCRAVASVLVGNPDGFEAVPVSGATRFQQLNDRAVDLLLYGDTHTIEREARERTTGTGFAFSSPYYYDGMAYFGDRLFVKCAEERKRHQECAPLRICAEQGSTGLDFVQSSFPPSFFVVGSSLEQNAEMLWDGECNVIASDRLLLLDLSFSQPRSSGSPLSSLNDTNSSDQKFVVGDKILSKEPLAIVTRGGDPEFSDAVDWVVRALFYGEERGLKKDLFRCRNHVNSAARAADLDFLMAVHCVGNYADVFGDDGSRGMNRINNGTTGMLYSVPFGRLDSENAEGDVGGIEPTVGATLSDVVRKGSLNCGVLVPDDFDGEVAGSDEIVGMSVEYCRTLAAALFHGDANLVDIARYSKEESSIAALVDGRIDVLAGGRVKRERDFGFSPSDPGVHFSSPYYYGRKTASDDTSFFALTTREDDATFSSFVNCLVLATIYAQEEIKKMNGRQKPLRIVQLFGSGLGWEMPLVQLFGSELRWALRDAIAYSGGYDEIYLKNFGDVATGDRGRNRLNDVGGPQLLSFPGLSSWHEKDDK